MNISLFRCLTCFYYFPFYLFFLFGNLMGSCVVTFYIYMSKCNKTSLLHCKQRDKSPWSFSSTKNTYWIFQNALHIFILDMLLQWLLKFWWFFTSSCVQCVMFVGGARPCWLPSVTALAWNAARLLCTWDAHFTLPTSSLTSCNL